MSLGRSPVGSRPPIAFLGLLGLLLVTITGTVVAVEARGLPFGLDGPWHDFLASNRVTSLESLSLLFNVVGGPVVMTIVTIAVVVLLVVLRRWREAVSIGLTVAAASALSSLIKTLVARPRPSDAIVDVASDSFPSGHVTTAAAITIAVAILFPRAWAFILAGVWISLMAFSRTYLLVHWLSDVVAGAVLGASVALIVTGALRMILKEPSPEGAGITG